jgi:hypothetical protein
MVELASSPSLVMGRRNCKPGVAGRAPDSRIMGFGLRCGEEDHLRTGITWGDRLVGMALRGWEDRMRYA